MAGLTVMKGLNGGETTMQLTSIRARIEYFGDVAAFLTWRLLLTFALIRSLHTFLI